MRRLLAVVVSACLAVVAIALLTGPPAAVAAAPITGRLVDATGSHPAVTGATVRLRTVTGSGPGAVVDTDVTDADGRFALDAGPEPEDEYYVQVVAGTYQGGWIGEDYVQPTPGYAVTWGPGAAMGRILANPAFIRGVVVDSATGRPVAGVKVTVRTAQRLYTVVDADTTGRKGAFRLSGIACEDNCALKFNGQAKGYEVGWRSCFARVVPTWGAACASPIGRIGKVFIDRR